MKFYKFVVLFLITIINCNIVMATSNSIFNENLTVEELETVSAGKVLIKNIKKSENISLERESSQLSNNIINQFEDLNPKYLAEIIKVKPYEENKNLPEILEELLYNVDQYAGIPYWSERHQKNFNLYNKAEIKNIEKNDNGATILADLDMDPFGIVKQQMDIVKDDDTILYIAKNVAPINYSDNNFELIKEDKMKIAILLFKYEDNWILYGIGGVNAPRFPFLTARIETAFIGRIKSFCNFIFSML